MYSLWHGICTVSAHSLLEYTALYTACATNKLQTTTTKACFWSG